MLPDGADTLDVGPSGRRAGVFRQLVQQIVNELLEEAVITAHHEVTYNSAQCNKACVIEVVTSIKISHNFMSNGLQVSSYGTIIGANTLAKTDKTVRRLEYYQRLAIRAIQIDKNGYAWFVLMAMMDRFLTASLGLASCGSRACWMDGWKFISNPGNIKIYQKKNIRTRLCHAINNQ